DEEYIQSIISGEIPVVLLDEPVISQNIFGVFFDNCKGGYIATKHLIELGHRRIACLTGPYSSITSIERMNGYKQAISEAGIAIDESIIMSGSYKEEVGFKFADDIIKSHTGVTAIFSASDFLALGVYKAAKLHGLKIPDDLSVAGFDDSFSTQLLDPELTDVRQPTYEMGVKATEMILKLITGCNLRKKVITLDPQLIIRQSTTTLKTYGQMKI
ncbi:MAG: LacI family DNA-binding transcriptional regulator, partial [Ruminiclostridium sp.]